MTEKEKIKEAHINAVYGEMQVLSHRVIDLFNLTHSPEQRTKENFETLYLGALKDLQKAFVDISDQKF